MLRINKPVFEENETCIDADRLIEAVQDVRLIAYRSPSRRHTNRPTEIPSAWR